VGSSTAVLAVVCPQRSFRFRGRRRPWSVRLPHSIPSSVLTPHTGERQSVVGTQRSTMRRFSGVTPDRKTATGPRENTMWEASDAHAMHRRWVRQ